MYKISVFIPKDSVEKVKQSLFDAGAGRIGNYEHCCWQTEGIGQFRPLENSKPHLGTLHRLESVAETKVELVCEDELIKQVIDALKDSHPYEEPAFDVWRLEDF